MTAASKWTIGQSGDYVMPELQSDFLDWLLSDKRIPSSQTQWAKENGVNERTVREWKRDTRFLAEWDRRAAQKNVSTERVQKALDTLWRIGTEQGDVQAITKWLEYSNRMRPPKKVAEDDQFAELSDADLVAEFMGELGMEMPGG